MQSDQRMDRIIVVRSESWSLDKAGCWTKGEKVKYPIIANKNVAYYFNQYIKIWSSLFKYLLGVLVQRGCPIFWIFFTSMFFLGVGVLFSPFFWIAQRFQNSLFSERYFCTDIFNFVLLFPTKEPCLTSHPPVQ